MYIAPLKALVRERVDDWNERMERRLGKRVVELTGDSSPDIRAIERADVIVTTPEKWDGISRSWQNRSVIFRDIVVNYIVYYLVYFRILFRILSKFNLTVYNLYLEEINPAFSLDILAYPKYTTPTTEPMSRRFDCW